MIMDDGNHMWWLTFGIVFLILFQILIVLGIVVLWKWLSGSINGVRPGNHRAAMDILKERYARSEIDRQEFEEKKTDLI